MPRSEKTFFNLVRKRRWSDALAAVEQLDPELRDRSGWTPLMVGALMEAPVELVRALLDRGVDPAVEVPYVGSALFIAAEHNLKEHVRALLQAGAPLQCARHDGASPLTMAAARGHEAVALMLLEAGADPTVLTDSGRSALAAAAFRGHEALARALLDALEPSKRAELATRALVSAARAGHAALIELLLLAGADCSEEGVFGAIALHEAAISGDAECVRLLLQAGSDPNLRAEHGRTPLHFLLHYSRATEPAIADCTQHLLEGGADPEHVDHLGYDGAAAARAKGHHQALRRIDPNAVLHPELSAIEHIELARGPIDVTYHPNEPVQVVGMASGHWRDRYGGGYTAAAALDKQRQLLVDAGLEWFLPILQRLAHGADLDLKALQREWAKHNTEPLKIVRFRDER
jgi:ankyrin repeat protein